MIARGHWYRIRLVGSVLESALEQDRTLQAMTDAMALSSLPEVLTLRTTLRRWRKELLAYFLCQLTNARTEGFNGKAKLVIRRAYGYKNFSNYRLRLLNACA